MVAEYLFIFNNKCFCLFSLSRVWSWSRLCNVRLEVNLSAPLPLPALFTFSLNSWKATQHNRNFVLLSNSQSFYFIFHRINTNIQSFPWKSFNPADGFLEWVSNSSLPSTTELSTHADLTVHVNCKIEWNEWHIQGTNASKVNCGPVYSAYILKPILSGRNL